MKKIAHFGAFDHDSYGDLLFPFVAEYLWPEFAFTHVAPTGRAPAWTDARPVVGVNEAIAQTDWDGILVGGGDIVQAGGWSAPQWVRHLDVPFAALPSVWAGASLLAAKLDVPAAWNAPGVPGPVPEFFAPPARAALECVDYLSVRDRRSQGHLADLTSKPIAVVADTAIAVARLWPETARRNHVVVSLSQHDLRTRPAEVRQAVLRLRRDLGADDVAVLPLMRWEFDPEAMAVALRDARIEARVATECASLESVARLIGSARGYVGNSLHGLVTALAYGVPGVLVVPAHNQASPKYAGFLQETGSAAARHLAAAWAAAPELLGAQRDVGLSAQVWERLERHRERVQAALRGTVSGKGRRWQQTVQAAHAEGERMALLGVPPRTFQELARHQTETLAGRVAEREDQLARNGSIYEAEIVRLQSECAEQIGRMGAQTARLTAEKTAALQDLAAVHRSWSWRLTAPVRALGRGVRRLHRGALAVRHRLVGALPPGAQRALHRAYARLRPLAAVGAGLFALPFRLVQYALHPGLRAKALNALARRWAEWRQRNRAVALPDLDWVLRKLELDVDPGRIAARIGPYLTRADEAVYGAMIGELRAAAAGAASAVVRAADLEPDAAAAPARRRILFVCGEFPNPVHGGGSRVADFIKALAADHDVYVAAWYDPLRDHAACADLEPHCCRLLKLSFENLEAGCADKLLELLAGQPADVVHYEWPRALNSFDRRLGRHHVYTHMEAVSCSLWIDLRRMEPLSPDWLRRLAQLLVMLKTEILDVTQTDAQIVVTAKDGEFLSRFAAGQTFYVVNHGINLPEFDVPEQPAEPRSLVFTGNFIHYPNVDAVHWFMREVRPRILAAVPDLRVWLVGAHPPADLQRYHDGAGVVVTGRVPDVRPWIQKAAVCIAPLVSGAGLRTKVVQYAALRRPCVATSIAVEDLGFADGRDVFVADAPDTFADRVVELLLDPARAAALVACARQRALDVYDNHRIARRDLGNLYRRLDAGKEPR
ncbi:MAG: glycosyltransferase [Spartobacteria bacterium]|nr:glycosyltransferase [Spartobacteria bacterium]